MVSLKLKHIDLANALVNLDAREVETKFSKSFVTYFMPVGDDIRAIFDDWIGNLTKDHLWGPADPLFPATLMEIDNEGSFRAIGLKRAHWSTANAVRRIFREAFVGAGLRYFHPHSLRHTLGQLGQKLCRSPEEFKAWSQNYGHDHVLTTFMSYRTVATDRQGEIIRQLATSRRPQQGELLQLLKQVTALVDDHDGEKP